MIIEHQNKSPNIHPSAYIAPNAVICGDVTIGENVRILFGAQVIAENNPILIKNNCIILENAVVRGCKFSSVSIGENCLLGPNSHLASCTLENDVFIATCASIFHGAHLQKGTEVRINGVVHAKSVLSESTIVPINWIAVGNPAQVFPPNEHSSIWKQQQKMEFNQSVYGANEMFQICDTMSRRLGTHQNDQIIYS